MVDEIRVTRLLRTVTEAVSALEREQGAGTARQSDPLWLPGVKYLMITAIEACVDTAQHICSSQRWETPADNGSAMRLLALHGVVGASVGDAMRRAVGFRNVLVHEYVTVDDSVVRDRLADLSDLTTFVRDVAQWLQRP